MLWFNAAKSRSAVYFPTYFLIGCGEQSNTADTKGVFEERPRTGGREDVIGSKACGAVRALK